MTRTYLTRRFGHVPDANTALTEIPGFDDTDRLGLAQAIDESRAPGEPFVTDAEAEAWGCVGDVLRTAGEIPAREAVAA